MRATSIATGVSTAVAVVALGVSIWAQQHAADVDERQQADAARQRTFQAQVEERQSAPALAPGVEAALASRRIAVPTPYGDVRKAAGELHVRSRRIVIPVYNVGAGLATIQGGPGFVDSCFADRDGRTSDPGSLDPASAIRRLSYYNVPPGQSAQLRYEANSDAIRANLRSASQSTKLHLLLFYTDSPLGRRLRWSCFAYTRPDTAARWTLDDAISGSRALPRR